MSSFLSSLRHLSAMSGKDMLRNPLTGFSMLFMFALFLAIYTSMWFVFTVLGPAPVTAVTPGDAEVVNALARAGVTTVDVEDHRRNATVALDGERAHVTLVLSGTPAWNPIWRGLRDAGFAPDAITVTGDDGDVKLDLLRANLGIVAMTGIASVAFIATTVPLVGMRERGLLRLFGTTPLRRSTFLLAQLPTRALVTLTMMGITVAIAFGQRYAEGFDLLSLAISLSLGAGMLFSFGFLCAARSRNAEATQQGMAMLTIGLAFASGGLLPTALLPAGVQVAMNCLPTTWLASAASASLVGTAPVLPLPALWCLMLLTSAGAALLAARLFEWDQSEPKITTRSQTRTMT